MNILYWLIKFGIAKDNSEAESICHRGSVRVNGVTVSNPREHPLPGSSITTLDDEYTYTIPREG